MKYVTYLIYIITFEVIVLGGAGYAVFVLDKSGWWFALAVWVSSCAYRPSAWAELSISDSKPKDNQ